MHVPSTRRPSQRSEARRMAQHAQGLRGEVAANRLHLAGSLLHLPLEQFSASSCHGTQMAKTTSQLCFKSQKESKRRSDFFFGSCQGCCFRLCTGARAAAQSSRSSASNTDTRAATWLQHQYISVKEKEYSSLIRHFSFLQGVSTKPASLSQSITRLRRSTAYGEL